MIISFIRLNFFFFLKKKKIVLKELNKKNFFIPLSFNYMTFFYIYNGFIKDFNRNKNFINNTNYY